MNRKNRGFLRGLKLAMLCTGWVLLSGCARDQAQFVELSGGSTAVQETQKEATQQSASGSQTQEGEAPATCDAQTAETKAEENSTGQTKEQTLYVHVCGAVHRAGVYKLPVNARVFEALDAAGGCTEDAAEERVNQARILTDGEELYIPTQEEILSGEGAFSADMSGDSPKTEKAGSEEHKVNINTADVSELTSLNGIGASRAQAIIDWREENGGFSSVEEIKNIDGIADKTYEKLKDRITVN